MGKYKKSKHGSDWINCPRSKCGRRNAPKNTGAFSPYCWKCNTFLGVTPVDRGDELVVTIDDIHETGRGVGHTDSGYVVMIDSLLPPAKAKVRITKVLENYAEGEVIDELETEDGTEEQEEDSDDDNDGNPNLGSRQNHWGN